MLKEKHQNFLPGDTYRTNESKIIIHDQMKAFLRHHAAHTSTPLLMHPREIVTTTNTTDATSKVLIAVSKVISVSCQTPYLTLKENHTYKTLYFMIA